MRHGWCQAFWLGNGGSTDDVQFGEPRLRCHDEPGRMEHHIATECHALGLAGTGVAATQLSDGQLDFEVCLRPLTQRSPNPTLAISGRSCNRNASILRLVAWICFLSCCS
jgi:hypothetical protein